MHENVELSSLDLRYEGHRLRDDARESRRLGVMVQRGIEEPLEGVDTCEARFLLNGFKRCRCARSWGWIVYPTCRWAGGGDGHAAKQCIIDNTNLAASAGPGKQAVIVAEMASFADLWLSVPLPRDSPSQPQGG